MKNFYAIAASRGDGLRPELQALFDRLAADPHSDSFVRQDGMVQSGPDPATRTAATNVLPLSNQDHSSNEPAKLRATR